MTSIESNIELTKENTNLKNKIEELKTQLEFYQNNEKSIILLELDKKNLILENEQLLFTIKNLEQNQSSTETTLINDKKF